MNATNSYGRSELSVDIKKSLDVKELIDFKFSVFTEADTFLTLNFPSDTAATGKMVFISSEIKHLTVHFQYKSKTKEPTEFSKVIKLDKPNLIKTQFHLFFDINKRKKTYLKSLTVDIIERNEQIFMTPVNPVIDSMPLFQIINNTENTFSGTSETNHFYGTISLKVEDGWISTSGTYCTSTALAKPLLKYDTTYSWIPSYFYGKEYRYRTTGNYKYVLLLKVTNENSRIEKESFNKGESTFSISEFVELETEFKLE